MGGLADKALRNFAEASLVTDANARGRVISVGPYRNRVAFAYQQPRAFAAEFRLWLARQSGKIDKVNAMPAILGRGVAGITLMALRGRYRAARSLKMGRMALKQKS